MIQGWSMPDATMIFHAAVLPGLLAAVFLVLAWRPWNRQAQVTRWQLTLTAMGMSLPWMLCAGYELQWPWRAWQIPVTSALFFYVAPLAAFVALIEALTTAGRMLGQPPAPAALSNQIFEAITRCMLYGMVIFGI